MAKKLRPLFGQIVPDAEPASIQLIHAGDTHLADERARLFRAWATDQRALRAPLVRSERILIDRVAQAGFNPDGTRLTPTSRRAVEQAIRDEMRDAFHDMESVIDQRVRVAVRRSRGIQMTQIDKLGLPPLDSTTRQQIEQTAVELLDAEFPAGSGLSYRQRLRRIRQQRTAQMMRVVRRSYADGDAQAEIAQEFNRTLSYFRPGTPIRGGTTYKQMRRLMVAEETRLANAVEIVTLQASGIRFAYWRLNPTHRWYGGKEICEVHASRVSAETVGRLERSGVPLDGISLEGLYPIDRYPTYPHPFCKCYPEPWMLPEQRREVDQRRREVEAAARELQLAVEGEERRQREFELERREQILAEAQGTLGRFEVSSTDAIKTAMYRLFGLLGKA